MADGIRVLASDGSGRVLFSNNVKNLFLVTSGTQATATNTLTQLGNSRLDISYAGAADSEPLLAIKPSTVTLQMRTERSGNTWTWRFVSEEPVSTSVPYWIFDKLGSVGTIDGIKIFNDAGELTYVHSATHKPFRLAALMQGNITTGIAFATSETLVTGREYALAHGRYAGHTKIGLGTGFGTQALHGRGFGGYGGTGSVNASLLLHSKSGNGTFTSADESYWHPYQFLVADVTDY